MKKLNGDLKNHTFEKVYLLYGDEAYLKRFYVNKFKASIAPGDDMNQKIQGEEGLNLSELKDFTDTMPFFADRRLLILTDTGLFKSASDEYAQWLDSLPDTCTVVFSETNVDKRNKLYKLIEKKGYSLELNHPDDRQFSDWVLKKIGGAKLDIKREDFDYLLNLLDRNLDSAETELEKLISYALHPLKTAAESDSAENISAGENNQNAEGQENQKPVITRQAVDLMISVHLESRIFDLVEQVALGNRKRALDLYYDLIELREPAMRILFLIGRQFHQMAVARALYAERKSREEIARALHLKSSFIVGKLLDQSNRFSLETVKACVEECVSLEEAVKCGNLNETLAVELFILNHTADRRNKL